MDDLPFYAGFDRRVLWTLNPEHKNAFVIMSAACAASTVIVGLGALYGGAVATGSVLIGLLLAAGSMLVVANMYRLLNAASGFPLHEPIARLELWKPGWAAIVVLLVLGVIMMQPVVLALMSVVHGKSGGLITQGLATWHYPITAGFLTFCFAALMSASAWLRRFFLDAVRAYERERWIEQRMFVDDAYAEAQEVIHEALDGTPGYERTQQHYADPPYNTRPLLFGFDPELLERDGVRFIKPAKKIADERELLEEEKAERKSPPRPDEEPPDERAEAPKDEAPEDEEEAFKPARDDELLEDLQDAIEDADEAMKRADEALKEPLPEDDEEERADEEQLEDEAEERAEEQDEEDEEERNDDEPDEALDEEEEREEDEEEREQDKEDEEEEPEEPFQAVRDDELLEDVQDAIEDADDAIERADEALKDDEERRRREEEDAREREEEEANKEDLPDETPEEDRADDAIDEADDLFGDDDDEDDEEVPPPALHYLEIGRMLPPRARRHMDEVAPFIASLTHRDEPVVRGLIRVAPDDLPMHRLFSEWKSLRSILLHNAGFALDHNMASIISIAVGRPTADVTRRLKAAPRDRRLAGVFAPELARKLLGRKI